MIIYCPNPESLCSEQKKLIYFTQSLSIESFPTQQERHEVLGRSLWKELHTKKNPTQKWFLDWLSKVPNTSSCGSCQTWSINWIDILGNEPDYENWFPWSVKFHNAVNTKLTRKQWTLEEAITCWIEL